jgi:hypothetical protein
MHTPNPRTCIALSTAVIQFAARAAQSCAVCRAPVAALACTRLNPRTCIVCPLQIHCSSVQHIQSAQPEREYQLTLGLFQHAHASIHAICIALSTADSLQLQCIAQSWCSSGARHYDALAVSVRTRLNPRTCISACPLQIYSVQCSTVLRSLVHEWSLTFRCSACTRPNPMHMHCFVHCRFTPLSAAQVYAAWSGVATRLLQHAITPQPRTCIAFVHCRFTAAQCSNKVLRSLGA